MIPHDERMIHDFGLFHLVTQENEDGIEFHVPVAETIDPGDALLLSGGRERIIELAGVLFCWLSSNGMTDRNREYFTCIARGVALWRQLRDADPAKYDAKLDELRKAMGLEP